MHMALGSKDAGAFGEVLCSVLDNKYGVENRRISSGWVYEWLGRIGRAQIGRYLFSGT